MPRRSARHCRITVQCFGARAQSALMAGDPPAGAWRFSTILSTRPASRPRLRPPRPPARCPPRPRPPGWVRPRPPPTANGSRTVRATMLRETTDPLHALDRTPCAATTTQLRRARQHHGPTADHRARGAGAAGEPRLTAAIPTENPSCSCKLTRRLPSTAGQQVCRRRASGGLCPPEGHTIPR